MDCVLHAVLVQEERTICCCAASRGLCFLTEGSMLHAQQIWCLTLNELLGGRSSGPRVLIALC